MFVVTITHPDGTVSGMLTPGGNVRTFPQIECAETFVHCLIGAHPDAFATVYPVTASPIIHEWRRVRSTRDGWRLSSRAQIAHSTPVAKMASVGSYHRIGACATLFC